MKRNKPKSRRAVWIGQNGVADDLLEAARRYIEHYKGKAVVIGPIELQHWPEDKKLTFRLAVKFTGRAPEKPR